MDDSYRSMTDVTFTNEIARAIYVVNRHAKTAPNPKTLYFLKKKSLQKLLSEGRAKKVGLHFSNNPKYSQQQSDVLVSAGQYYFHMPPSKEDFQNLPHLGSLNNSYRNPKTNLPLSKAKVTLQQYVGIKKENAEHRGKNQKRTPHQKPVFKRLGESYF
ncbi:YkyB family protein [Bacillus sp. FJAT-47783]|uniref:YkyB family protein n=1 Tax=Bacillus sp. FJAT-47783 TaxID=2922712 RepID=UPI001FABFFEE|nr:YkyB family protein [Bacillus sp. FJAT-47783]